MIPKRIDSFQVYIPYPERFQVNFEHCGFCGTYDATIRCQGGCGATIIHNKTGLSIAHRCLACNAEDGKGE